MRADYRKVGWSFEPSKNSPRERAIRNAFGEYKGNAKRKGISFNLTLDQFRGFVIAPCAYCFGHPSCFPLALEASTGNLAQAVMNGGMLLLVL